ncbi:MAG TPA: helix-turn-helix domain-containing protein [Thermopolyspora sp.]|jgi:Transcriptional regulator
MRENTDTRSRIQEVALDLFTERGYEATSLREIAEVLGVTKAALYYHFRTKEDIVSSLTEDRLAAMQRLIDWAQTQPRTIETRVELIRRYSEELRRGRHPQVMSFMERNQASLRDHPKMGGMRDKMLELVNLLSDVGDPPTTRLKCAFALFSLHAPWFLLRDQNMDDEELRQVGIQVAMELIGADGPVSER